MKRVMLVDYMGSVYTHFHAKETNLPVSFLGNIRDIIRTYKVDRTLILQEGGSEYRMGLLPSYKSARKERKAKQTDAEKAEFQKFLNEAEVVTQTLELLGCTPLQLYGAEADDLAGYLCATLPPEEYQLLLLSEDSDWGQLLKRPNTVQASYKAMTKTLPDLPKEHWLSYSKFTEVKGLTPEQWFEKKMLTGDTADSIPGIKGLGDTGATRLLEKYGSIAGIMENKACLDIPRMKQEAKDSLQDCKEVLDLGFKLMNLRWTKEEWVEILKQQGKYSLTNFELRAGDQNVVDLDTFTELCYEKGWMDFLDPQWSQPFYG